MTPCRIESAATAAKAQHDPHCPWFFRFAQSWVGISSYYLEKGNTQLKKKHMLFSAVIVLQADLFELIKFFNPTERRFISSDERSSVLASSTFSRKSTITAYLSDWSATLAIKIICSIWILFNIIYMFLI